MNKRKKQVYSHKKHKMKCFLTAEGKAAHSEDGICKAVVHGFGPKWRRTEQIESERAFTSNFGLHAWM